LLLSDHYSNAVRCAPQKSSVIRDAYGPGPNVDVEFLAATVYYEAGMLDSAFAIFDSLYKKFNQRPFQGEDKKYLQFYKTRAQNR
jgi:hypothetical protein